MALAALLSGGLVAVALLVVDRSDPATADYLVAARDVAAGSVLSADVLAHERLRLGGGARLAFRPGSEPALAGSRAAHDLASGQLIQRADISRTDTTSDRRLVWLPLKELPPLGPGDRLDLLEVAGPPEHVTVTPFAFGVAVLSVGAGGVVVAVSSLDAPGFVYAAAAARLVGVSAAGDAAPGQETPVSSLEQARALLRH